MKKILSIVLSITMLFSLTTTAFAESEGVDDRFNPNSFPADADLESELSNRSAEDELIIVDAPDGEKVEATIDAAFDSRAASSTVAVMRIFAINDGGGSSFNTSGHAFLSIENTSGSTITVGGLSVEAGKTVTVGTWGNKDEHTGLWYNLEGYFQNQSNAYSNAVSLRVSLSSNLLETVSTNIKNNDSWGLLSNCSTFATKIWNSVCSTKVSAGTPNTPTSTVNSIKSYTDLYSTGVAIPYFGTVYYGNPPKQSSVY